MLVASNSYWNSTKQLVEEVYDDHALSIFNFTANTKTENVWRVKQFLLKLTEQILSEFSVPFRCFDRKTQEIIRTSLSCSVCILYMQANLGKSFKSDFFNKREHYKEKATCFCLNTKLKQKLFLGLLTM